jgi:hypothetical protein
MADTMTSQNIDLSSWDIAYIFIFPRDMVIPREKREFFF